MTFQQMLLSLARASIEEAFDRPFKYDRNVLATQFPELSEKRATFVTLKTDAISLRGCIGSITPYRPLFDDIVSNAKAAAFHDPRFAPLQAREYQRCSVEVSLLTVPQELTYENESDLRQKIRPGIDGVILEYGGRSATFLPQVWEDLNGFDPFFSHLGIKAGLGSNVLDYHPQIKTYQAEHFESAPLQGGEL